MNRKQDSATKNTDRGGAAPPLRLLADVPLEEEVVLVRIDVAGEDVEPLLERGIVPGCTLCPVRHAPAGGPTVYRVDGSLVALRRETASCLCVRSALEAAGVLDSN
ncbi:MAG: FeoA family protein [Gemmatimonadota bacterium]|nr:FeoA family protein [Gemmatimonadota bacterium]MDE2870295.1 FeoA family protein [Gemmatimonadota bacterium]